MNKDPAMNTPAMQDSQTGTNGMNTDGTDALAASKQQAATAKKRRLLVTGSRNWTDRVAVECALREAWEILGGGEVVLVHGAARGADSIAAEVWQGWGLDAESHPADWANFGRSAGPRRNREMVAAGADLCLAFPLGESRGTRGCMSEARSAGIPVRVVGTGNSEGNP